MIGLIIKDILNLRKNIKTTLVMIVFFFIIAYSSDDPSYIIGMVVMIMSMMSITSMSYDEFAKWDRYALAMPITRNKIVLSKYILSILLSTSSVLLATAISYTFIIQKSGMELKELLLIAYIVFCVSILFSASLLPLIYKFGVEKSRLLMMAVFGLPVAIVFSLSKIGISMPNENQLITLLKISPLIVIIFIFISSFISIKIYKGKDF